MTEKNKKKIESTFGLGELAKEIGGLIEIKLLEERPYRQEIEKKLIELKSKKEKLAYLKKIKKTYYSALSADTVASSGVISKYVPAGYELFSDRWLSEKIIEVQSSEDVTLDPIFMIDSLLLPRYREIEKKAIKYGITTNQIACAAFCELLFEKGYFGKKEKRIKKCVDFAKQWHPNIKTQLKGKRMQQGRLPHRSRIISFF